ncbi:hypothetical protein PISMIDRAFT_214869 [Pisolithus microcarpus 441]|uniref:Uncharacterized protein n=1 Tax=Pisolithus microcarpus 441 TaxID=765257 RepID=A0A0C9Z5B4_9AGAM|nr:hypothetical protein BKA83DRAFT_214869 [Pisolithus microcarpus]KIK17627.1 hypothetical protein PISMIDRAFT_214869 [Pisolithus microcarpus 441]
MRCCGTAASLRPDTMKERVLATFSFPLLLTASTFSDLLKSNSQIVSYFPGHFALFASPCIVYALTSV